MKNRRHALASAVVLMAVGTAFSEIGRAYVLGGYKWASREVPYYVNPANADVSQAAALAAIQAGAEVWSAQTNSGFRFVYAGYTSGTALSMNNRNEVFFRNSTNNGLVAETMRWFDGSGNLLDTDIVFYDGGWKFFTGSSGCSEGVYLEDYAAHEFGHALGLKHSSSETATMYSTAKWCSTSWRSLDSDDIAGVEKLYPPTTTNTVPTVAIASPATGTSASTDTTLTFTGSASDKEDGNLGAKMTWHSNLLGQIGSGTSFSRKLTAGSHTVTASVTDSGGKTSTRQISVSVAAQAPTNSVPSVSITAPASNTSVTAGTALTFTGTASDTQDGNLTSKIVWSSNLDGPLGMGGSVTKMLTAGSHSIRATVTDSGSLSNYRQIAVTVTAAAAPTQPSGAWLTAVASVVKTVQRVTLKWSGVAGTKVDLYRNGTKVSSSVSNDGRYVDSFRTKVTGSFSYLICKTGTTVCTNSAVASF